MNYKESEKVNALNIRNAPYEDDAEINDNKSLAGVQLKDPENRLRENIRKDVVTYFNNNSAWHVGNSSPMDLLPSHFSCLNHLFFLRHNRKAALRFLQRLDPDFVGVCDDFDGGYVGFGVHSQENYLGESSDDEDQAQRAKDTSVDAMMTGIKKNYKKTQVLISWQCKEAFDESRPADGYAQSIRPSKYTFLVSDPESPIECTIPIECLYIEPFYRLISQTLLAWQMIKHKNMELNAEDWIHIDVIPEDHLHLRYRVQVPGLSQSSMEEAWKSQLKAPKKFRVITPQRLLRPFLNVATYTEMINYLNETYW